MVPLGQNIPASIPKSDALMASSWFTEGSSPKTSSPTGAFIMASSMAGVGRVTVSERKSIIGCEDSWYGSFNHFMGIIYRIGSQKNAFFCPFRQVFPQKLAKLGVATYLCRLLNWLS